MVAKDNIKREIESGKQAIVKRNHIKQDSVVEEILRIAYADLYYLYDDNEDALHPKRVPLATRRAVSSVENIETTVTTGTGARRRVVCEKRQKMKFHDKLAALDKLCGLLGLKTVSIPPIELLLSMLPAEIGSQLRTMLAPQQQLVPSVNGNGGH